MASGKAGAFSYGFAFMGISTLFGFRRRKRSTPAPAAFSAEGPEPVEVPVPSVGQNPIHRLLDDWRLPWHETRAEVIARVGVSLDPTYQWEALVFSDSLSLPGAIQPWTANVHDRIPPQFPITRFASIVWFEDDAHENLLRTANCLAASLGAGRIGRRWNTLVAHWQSGLAEVSLTAWPSAWQSSGLVNAAQDRDKRLRTACHIHVATSFCLPLSTRERTWVKGFQPFRFDGPADGAGMAKAGTTAPNDSELEYVRNPEHLVDGHTASFGLSLDGDALVVISDQLFVIPLVAILRLQVTRLTPAKGKGGSTLHVICQTQAEGVDGQYVLLAQHPEPDGLNAFAQSLGHRLRCPVIIGPRYPDA